MRQDRCAASDKFLAAHFPSASPGCVLNSIETELHGRTLAGVVCCRYKFQAPSSECTFPIIASQ